MPLQLPNLDDRTYEDLVEEALSLIPTYDPEWTNHNPSDPGIALVELFAYLSEILIYRLNRVTDDNLRTFLKLLNGPDWTPTQDLREETRLAVLRLRTRDRAVTAEDYERLSTENFNNWLTETQQTETVGLIQRTHGVVERNLEMNNEGDRKKSAPGHVSVVILPANNAIAPNELGPQPTEVQRQKLWDYLDERRMLTTRHHVVGPIYAPVSAEILVARRPDVLDEELRRQIVEAINNFLSPLPVATIPTHQGWPFGRDVYVSEFYELLENIEGVDYLPDIKLLSQCQPQNQHCVAAEPIWHEAGDQIGLRLDDHHLPTARLDPNQIVIAPNLNFLVVQLRLSVVPRLGTDPKTLKREIKQRVRNFFHPLHGGPGPQTASSTTLRQQDLSDLVKAIAGVESVGSMDLLPSDPTRSNEGLLVKEREVVDLRLEVEVQRVNQ